MGHLVRYGADVIEAVDPSGPEEPLLVQQCSEIIMDFFENTTGITQSQCMLVTSLACIKHLTRGCVAVDLKVRASALQALGSVFIARPTCMFSERARKLQMAVLQRKAEHDLKIRALNNLADLLKVSGTCFSRTRCPHNRSMIALRLSKGWFDSLRLASQAEEHRLVLKQEDTLDENGQKGDGLAEQENAPLATINGQTDVLTSSSTILQVPGPAAQILSRGEAVGCLLKRPMQLNPIVVAALGSVESCFGAGNRHHSPGGSWRCTKCECSPASNCGR